MNRHIESIRIQDFQNHQDTHIKLYPGLNLITGSSDSGKSGLFRSLSTAFLDIFRKQDVRDGQKNAQITINFKNGDYYKRIKGDTNELEFQYAGKELQKHSRFSKQFPQEALDFLGHIPKTSTGALSFANQEDKLFLINLSDEALPKEISRLLGIHDLEEAASNLGSDINKISGDIKRANTEIENTKKKLEPFEGLDEKLESLEKLNDLVNKYQDCETYIHDAKSFFNDIATLINRVRDCKNEINHTSILIDFFSESIPILENSFSDIEDGLKMIEDISKARDNFFKSKKQYEKYFEISEGTIGNLILESVKLQLEYTLANELEESLQEASDSISETEKNTSDENKIISKSNKEIERLKKYLSENFDLCETCGKPV